MASNSYRVDPISPIEISPPKFQSSAKVPISNEKGSKFRFTPNSTKVNFNLPENNIDKSKIVTTSRDSIVNFFTNFFSSVLHLVCCQKVMRQISPNSLGTLTW